MRRGTGCRDGAEGLAVDEVDGVDGRERWLSDELDEELRPSFPERPRRCASAPFMPNSKTAAAIIPPIYLPVLEPDTKYFITFSLTASTDSGGYDIETL